MVMIGEGWLGGMSGDDETPFWRSFEEPGSNKPPQAPIDPVPREETDHGETKHTFGEEVWLIGAQPQAMGVPEDGIPPKLKAVNDAPETTEIPSSETTACLDDTVPSGDLYTRTPTADAVAKGSGFDYKVLNSDGTIDF